MSLVTTYSPTVPVGGATSYKLVVTYSNGYLEVYRRFQGDLLVGGVVEKRGYVGGTFLGGICHGGRKFP